MKSKIRKTRIFGIMLLLIGSIAIWILILSPRLQQTGLLNTQKEQAIAQKKTIDDQVLVVIESKKDIAGAQQKIDILSERFPSAIDSIGFQDQVNGAIAKAGLNASNIQSITLGQAPAASAETTSIEVAVDINISGSYEQLAAVIDNLYAIKRALSISSISLSETANANVAPGSFFSLKVTGKTFLFPTIPPVPAELFN